MDKFLIVRTGGTFPDYAEKRKDFEHWTAEGMGLADGQWQCVNVQAGESLPAPAGFAGAAITGSHDMVTDGVQWIHDTRAWVCRAVDAGLPLLGICFGHQLMAAALGGEAGYHPDGVEIGTADISLTEEAQADPLLGGLPAVFKGHVTHSQTALRVPPGAALLAGGDVAAFSLATCGVLHGMRLVENDDSIEIGAQPFDDLLDAGNPFSAIIGAQRSIG